METKKDTMHQLHDRNAKLILPEYGRNVQQMVNICKNIEDRNERNRCARTIINFMGNMFPYLRDVESFKHKLWDHLAIMSDYELDIDYPFEVVKKDTLDVQPSKIAYSNHAIKYMHYGRNIENFIDYIANHNDIKNHDELVKLIATHMKRCYGQFNKDSVDNLKIIQDLENMSDGKISFNKDLKLYDARNANNRRYNNNSTNHSNNRMYDKRNNQKTIKD